MGLNDVLLSLLREPMSGSELIDLFRSSIRHFWQADLSQVYRALDALEKDGCVRSRSIPSQKGPARRVYTLTDRGRRRLIDWVRREPSLPAVKFEYLAQLFSVTADENPTARAREQLEALRREATAALRVLEGIDGAMRAQVGDPDEFPANVFYPWLTLRHGLLRRRALVEWIDECLVRLDRRAGGEAEIDPADTAELFRMLREFAETEKARRR